MTLDKRGRTTIILYKTQVNQLLEALANNLPQDLGINGIFWTASSVRELIKHEFDVDRSAYLVRRLLEGWGFPKRKQIKVFERDSYKTEWLSLHEYAKSQNMLCYCLKSVTVRVSFSVHNFYCIISTRGDMRFVGSQYLSKDNKNWFISKLHQVAKKKIVVASDNISTTSSDKQEISIE